MLLGSEVEGGTKCFSDLVGIKTRLNEDKSLVDASIFKVPYWASSISIRAQIRRVNLILILKP